MAGNNGTSECESLKRLLNDTAAACQKCLAAVDTVASKQLQHTAMQSTTVSLSLSLSLSLSVCVCVC